MVFWTLDIITAFLLNIKFFLNFEDKMLLLSSAYFVYDASYSCWHYVFQLVRTLFNCHSNQEMFYNKITTNVHKRNPTL